jgi:hypothetical protein
MAAANALTYYDMATITAVKNMVQFPSPRPLGKRTRELLKMSLLSRHSKN